MPANEDIVTPVPGIEYLTYEDVNILLNIQRLWLNIIQWIRYFFHSVLGNHPDSRAVGARLFVQLPMDIYNEFIKYFNVEDSQQLLNIVSRLFAVNWQLATAYKNNDKTATDFSTTQWYRIADELAAFLANINKYFDEAHLKTLFHEYIDLRIKEMIAFLDGDYDLETILYDEIEEKVVRIASYMAMGVIAMRHTNLAIDRCII